MKELKSFESKDSTVAELIPIVKYDEQLECFEMRSGEKYMDMVQVVTMDLIGINEQEKAYLNMQWAKFYKTCAADIKIVALNFPTDTSEQQRYFEHKIRKCKNSIFRNELENKLSELIYIEKNRTDKEFYMMVFADSEQKLKDIRDNILSVLGSNNLIVPMERNKKEMILYKYNNPNTALFAREKLRES